MTSSSPLKSQISNRNLLTTTGFKFILSKYPKVDFFSNSASIPSINLGVAIQPSYLKDIGIGVDRAEDIGHFAVSDPCALGNPIPLTATEYTDVFLQAVG